MLFEKAAALTFADINLSCDVFQGNLLHVMLLNKDQNLTETFEIPVWGGRRRSRAFSYIMGKKRKPDGGEHLLDFHLKESRAVQIQIVNPVKTVQNLAMPVHGGKERQRAKSGIGGNGGYIVLLQNTAFKSVDHTGMEGGGKIVAVTPVDLMPGVEGIGVTKETIPFAEMVDLIVDLVTDLPL